MRKTTISLVFLLLTLTAWCQQANYAKMSSMVRQLAMETTGRMRRMPSAGDRELCAFVRIEGNADSLLALYGGRSLARFGNLHVASIPLRSLSPLSLRPEVSRIEARQGNSIQMDTTVVLLGGAKAHAGELLPQAFTGRGVVVGVQDIGFDLTHPNFYDTSLSEYRIKRMWDFLSLDTLGSDLYVGAEYTTEEALKTYAHSRDAHIISHGTHTLGCAAGSGYVTSYRGMAPGSDICLVSNAVTEDISLIDSADVYKYTYALDALGFKYIFDYAKSVGKPCVVSFSEGSMMDFRGDDALYYEMLDSLVGPGRIIVASAGNAGHQVAHVVKPVGMESARVALISGGSSAYFSVKTTSDDYMLDFVLYGPDNARQTYLGFNRMLNFHNSLNSPWLRNNDNTEWVVSAKTGLRVYDWSYHNANYFGMPAVNRGDYWDNYNDESFNSHAFTTMSAKYFANIKLPAGFNFRTSISIDDNNAEDFGYTSAVHEADQIPPYGVTVRTSGGDASRTTNHTMSSTWNNLLTWDKSFGDHNFNAMVGHEYYDYKLYYNYGYGEGIMSLGQYELASTTANWSSSSNLTKYALLSFLGKAEYN